MSTKVKTNFLQKPMINRSQPSSVQKPRPSTASNSGIKPSNSKLKITSSVLKNNNSSSRQSLSRPAPAAVSNHKRAFSMTQSAIGFKNFATGADKTYTSNQLRPLSNNRNSLNLSQTRDTFFSTIGVNSLFFSLNCLFDSNPNLASTRTLLSPQKRRQISFIQHSTQ